MLCGWAGPASIPQRRKCTHVGCNVGALYKLDKYYMETKVQNILINIKRNSTVLSDEDFNTIIQSFNFKFPESYTSVMRYFNGGEGEIGHDSWLCLFPLEELNQTNKNYSDLMSEIPDYFLFGKDAADTGYAFHKSNGTFHSFGLMSNFKTDPIDFIGNDFTEFLEWLEDYKYNT